MKFIIKVHPEIMMKSVSVRKRFIKVLSHSIRNVLKTGDETVAVVQHWDFIEVRSRDESKRDFVVEKLTSTPGIHHILEVAESSFQDLHDIYEQVLAQVKDEIVGKTFCVRAKRRGEHEFDSMELMRYVGGGLNQAVPSATVKLKNPDVVVKFEIDGDKLRFVKSRTEGLGGFPLGTQEDVLSLISGGFDSGVASFEFIRRGCRVHYLFFNMGGRLHEMGTKQMAYGLWQRYGSSHKVRFITVNFEPVVAEILAKIDDGQMGVVLKRMMMRVASRIAKTYKLEALVTGEALGQVASQTLSNLRLIDDVASVLVLRPLITQDKQSIIEMAQNIGTDKIAQSMPEFCGVISKSPTAKAIEHKLLATEADFDNAVLDRAVETAVVMDIRDIANEMTEVQAVEFVSEVGVNDVVIDIRTLDEQDEKPLNIDGATIIQVPFYQLGTKFGELDKNTTYLLYCQQGVMSGLQAAYLGEQGFGNVKVLRLI